MFFIFGLSIALFLAFILIGKKEKTLADSILAAMLMVSAGHLGLYYHHSTPLINAYPQLIGWALPIPLLYGPFLFTYTSALTQPVTLKNRLWLLHFLPPFLLYLYITPFLFKSASEKRTAFQQGFPPDFYFDYLHGTIMIVSGFGYAAWAAWLLHQHKRRIAHLFSNSERVNLNWLRYLIYSLGGLWVFVAIGNDAWVFTAAVLYIFFIGYFGIKQVGIFTNLEALTPPQYFADFEVEKSNFVENDTAQTIDSKQVAKKKYQKSGLSEEQADKVQRELSALMQAEKLYINPELTLADLATRLAIHPNYLSQMLNEKEGVSFYDYINNLRIEEFKQQIALPKNKNYTLLTVAFDCGFNSKSSFNRYFKKVMDVQPSAYVRGLTSN